MSDDLTLPRLEEARRLTRVPPVAPEEEDWARFAPFDEDEDAETDESDEPEDEDSDDRREAVWESVQERLLDIRATAVWRREQRCRRWERCVMALMVLNLGLFLFLLGRL